MDRLIKRALSPFWRMVGPIRRPIARRVDARLNHMIAVAIQERILPPIQASLDTSSQTLARLEGSLWAANHSASMLSIDMDLMLGSLVREVARLQVRVDEIRETIDEANGLARSGLSLVGSAEDDGPVSRPQGGERARVG